MSPSELLEKLTALGTIDERILRKIRRQVESPDKVVKTSAVLKFLIKQEAITQDQAKELLEPTPPPTAKPADDFAVAEAPADNDYDTDDLTGNVNSPDTPAAADPTPVPTLPVEVDLPEPEIPADEPVEEVPVQSKKSRKREAKKPAPATMLIEDDDLLDDAGPVGFDAETALDMGEGLDEPSMASAAGTDSADAPVAFNGKIDKTDQWKTKWVYIGFGILGTILIATAVLWYAVMGVNAEEQYKHAVNSFEASTFQAAVGQFDEYIKANPRHKDIHNARALRAQAVLAGNYTGRQWEETLKRAEVELPPLADNDYKESKLARIRNDLAVMLPGSLLRLTQEAVELTELPAMEADLAKITTYKATIDNRVYIPESLRKNPTNAKVLDEIENNILTVRGHINKENDYKLGLVEIGKLAGAGETNKAFQTFRKLTRNYGDLGSRAELRDLMLSVSARERDLVNSVSLDTLTSATAAASPISKSVVLAAKSGTPLDGLRGEVVSFLAEGSVYGIDLGDGSIVWRHFVGYETTIQPQPLDEDSLVLVDSKRLDVLRINKRSGDVVWRTEIGEPMFAPTLAGPHVIVTTAPGHVLKLDSQTGDVLASVKLPQKANTSATANERDPFIYQTGYYSNLYVLSREDLTCKEVYYVGHSKASIVVPPFLWSGHVLVAVNGSEHCELHVLKPTDNGLGLELVQLMSRLTTGPVTAPLQRFGRWLFVIADNGDMRLLELDAANELNPVRTLASDRVDNSSGQRLFALTEGSNLWLASQGILRYRIKRALGQFDREVIMDPADTFLAPMQTIDDTLFHVRRRDRSGMVSASLVDERTLKPIWRTDLGGALAGSPIANGDSIVAVDNQGDLFSVDASGFERGVAGDAVRSSSIVEDLQFSQVLPIGNNLFSVLGPLDRSDAILIDADAKKSRLFTLDSPADKPASKGLVLGGKLIVPTEGGQVTRINPANGRMAGTPFQPPKKPGTTSKWFEPVLVSDNVFAITSGLSEVGLNDSALFLVDGSNKSRLSEVGSYQPAGKFASGPVLLNNSLYAVVRGDEGDSVVSLTAQAPVELQETSNLEGKCVGGPWAVGDRVLLLLDTDELVSIGSSLDAQWSVGLPNQKFAFAPTNTGQGIMLGFQNGLLVWLNPETGQTVSQQDLGQPILHTPAFMNRKLYFGGMDGTVHQVDPAAFR